jgi:YHS domain-containing protein
LRVPDLTEGGNILQIEWLRSNQNRNSSGLRKPSGKEISQMLKDLVCGRKLDETMRDINYVHHGRTYYFCSPVCRERFVESPEQYISFIPALRGEDRKLID